MSIRDVFDFIYQTISDDSVDRFMKIEFKKEIMRGFGRLVVLDPESSARILLKYFPNDVELFLSKMDSSPDLQYSLLRSIYHLSLTEEFDVIARLDSNSSLNEKYIHLLCEYDPKGVYLHLLGHPEYDLNAVLNLCRERRIRDAYAYLLEQSGDLISALKINLDNLFEQLEKCRKLGGDESELWRLLRVAADLCERSSQRKDTCSLQCWSDVLSRIVSLQLGLEDKSEGWYNDLLVRMVREFVGYMNVYVSMENILRCVFSTGPGLKFKPYREVIEHMLSSFGQDWGILRTALKCFESDVRVAHRALRDLESGARVVNPLNCVCCGGVLGLGSGVLVYECSHCVHSSCLEDRCPACVLD